jgi:hypothetical protein
MKFENYSIAIILLIVFSAGQLIAQDSTETDEEWEWEWNWEFDEFEEWVMFGKRMPTISVSYGLPEFAHKKIAGEFAKTGAIELKLGHTTRRASKHAGKIIKYNYRYLFISNISSDLRGSSLSGNELNTKTWRFGFSGSTGFGYKFGNAAIIPYFTYSHDWTRVSFINTANSLNDQEIINRFDKSFRFGTSNEAGIRLMVTSLISLEAGYERAVIFERHLFWKWAGSGLIEIVSHSLLDVFIKEIFESSAAAGPVVYLILKSALGYGIYELRQEKMNWPFNSAPPLSIDSFKFGMTFTF